MKLNQIIAIEKTVKNQTATDLTATYHLIQKPVLFQGIARTYRPKDDEGDKLPPESNRVQVTCEDMLSKVSEILIRLLDTTATKDVGNCSAFASVTVDGTVLIKDAPVPYLLFLEKKLVDIHTFVRSLPTLDPTETWEYDSAQNCYAARPAETTKTKKVLRNHVKAEATAHHPAQVETYSEDIVVGYWTTIKYSGAIPAKRAAQLISRVEKLQEAVKFAREQANLTEVKPYDGAKQVFSYLFG